MKKSKGDPNVFELAEERRKLIVAVLKNKSPQTTKELKQYFPDSSLSSFRHDLWALEQYKRIKVTEESYPFKWSLV